LDAIFGTEKPTIKATPMNHMAEIAISEIIPNPTQPRTKFDDEALQELADSIRQLGVIQPITVKKTDDGKYIIISGERRWRASQIVGLENLPAYIREADDENLHAMALVENIQRQDLNAIEIALGMQRLIEECGLTQEAMADKVGKKRSTVSNYMRLLNLPNEVQLALKEGLITMGHAKAIAGIEADKQVWALKRCIKKALSVRQAEELARKLAEQPQGAEPIEEDYPESYSRLVEQLEPYFSDNISIKRGKSGGGKIVIDFANDEEIEQFIERLRNK
jgi:ParB family chromosome partitioning protein